MKNLDELYQELERRNKQADEAGGVSRIAKQHESGKKIARERIVELLDPGTFNELDKFVTHRNADFGMGDKHIAGDGVVAGYGKIDGRLVYVYAYDFTVFGGTLSRANANKIIKLQQLANKMGAPIIGLNDSGGARIQEGVQSLAGYAEIFHNNVRSSGVIPQITCIMGPCAGGAVYSPALTDFIVMVKDTSYMFVTGPDVIKAVTHEEVSKDELGGAITHNSKSGVAHFFADSEEQALMLIRELMSFLPVNNMEEPPVVPTTDDPLREDEALQTLVPADPNKPYDIKDLILSVVDDKNFLEVQPLFAKNIVVGFARMAGHSVGIVANQPAHLAGVLDIDASVKGARFIRFCDAFNIPIVTFVDVPGFLPGINQESNGIIKHGAKLLYAYSEATVPKIALITRKAYGGAYCVMSSKQVGADINYAYPMAEIAVMGPEGAVNILHKSKIESEETRQQLIDEYRETFANPYRAAELGYIDEVIYPRQTRSKIIQALDMTRSKSLQNPPKKHGNIAL
ncbi:MAG: acyl-CoA carboxylase subunit beta [Bacteroidales bacterium]|nr:acyl-CoA carboxylase subunit beta [Bacteroidales bacterium]HRX32216.1 acyl-CoA carboxylase subunit beta [Tenuifilaceae bacterium]